VCYIITKYMHKRRKILHKSVLFIFLITISLPLVSTFAFEEPIFTLIKKAEEKARIQRIEAEKKAKAINNYYTKGKAHYQRGNFAGAIANFEELLKIEPNYEPAKLYLQCSILQQKMCIQQEKINSIKLKMADIVADYDKRIKHVEGLALGYLLEQALLRCQAGNFTGAEYYYNLCYKLDPQSKERISWFVNATYELKDLSDSLDECYRKIEQLSEAEDFD